MDTSEWIYQIIVEGMKYIIIAHWFLGFTFSQKKTKYFLLIYPVVVPVVQYLTGKATEAFPECSAVPWCSLHSS